METIKDFEKLECPFVRKQINGRFVTTPAIAEDFEWVFHDSNVKATEKLHGFNVSIYIQNGRITHIWGKGKRINFFNVNDRTAIEGLLNSYAKGYMEFLKDGQHFCEIVGPGVNKNMYNLDKVYWIPFKKCQEDYAYESWGKYPKTFESISEWFKTGLQSLFSNSRGTGGKFVEGIVFVHRDGRMAKLRRDMFDWYYDNPNAKAHKEE